ncbi:replicase polyprotein [Acrasis kona]|uniref:Replicase polyprotein n=1 Tax=Acrasis kona TaxID=1008807 RepID=A0AAW2Z0A9_9EUKA
MEELLRLLEAHKDEFHNVCTNPTYFSPVKVDGQKDEYNDEDDTNDNDPSGFESKTNEMWEPFRTSKAYEREISAVMTNKDIHAEIRNIITLAQLEMSTGLNGESYRELICALDGCDRLQLEGFDPQNQYEHARALFILSIVLHSVGKKSEAIEYLETAQEKVANLVSAIGPTSVTSNNQSISDAGAYNFLFNLVYNDQSKLLLSEILLQQSKLDKSKNHENVFESYLLPCLQLLYFTSGDEELWILNANVFGEAVKATFQNLTLRMQNDLAKRVLEIGLRVTKDQSTCVCIHKTLSDMLEKELKKSQNPTQGTNKFKDDDDDDGWPDDDDDDNQIVLNKQQAAPQIILGKNDDTDDEGWPDDDEDDVKPPKIIPPKIITRGDDDSDDGWPDDDEDEDIKQKQNTNNEDDDDWPISDDDLDEEKPSASTSNNSTLPKRNPFALLLEEPQTPTQSQDPVQLLIFDESLRLCDSLDFLNKKIQRDVQVPVLRSMRTRNGDLSFSSKKQMKVWLTDLCTHKKPSSMMRHLSSFGAIRAEEMIMSNHVGHTRGFPKFSINWSKDYLETCWKLYNLCTERSLKECHKLVNDYFSQLPQHSTQQNSTHYPNDQDLPIIYNYSLQLLRIAALLWAPEEHALFKNNLIDSLVEFVPQHTDAARLIEAQTLAHHINIVWNSPMRNSAIADIIPTLLDVIHLHDQQKEINCNPTLQWYQTMPTSDLIVAEALVTLHQFLSGCSPLTLAPLFDTDDDNGEMTYDEEGDIIAGIVSNLDAKYRKDDLLQFQNRIKKLEYIYDSLQLSLTKIIVAITLGQNRSDESTLFESVYMLDWMTNHTKPHMPLMTTDIGTRALCEFARALANNDKFSFASIAYQAALSNNKIVHPNDSQVHARLIIKDHHAALNNNEQDWQRQVFYAEELMNRARDDCNVAQVIYLCEKLCKDYLDHGDVKSAENCVMIAVEFLRQKDAAQQINLYLNFADLLLRYKHFERCIDVVAKMIEDKLTNAQRITSLLYLSECYLCKQWSAECEAVLFELSRLLEKSSDLQYITQMLLLTAKCYYMNNQLAEALHAVNIILNSKHPKVPSWLARLFVLKGDILFKLTSSSNPIEFPTALEVDAIYHHSIFSRFVDSKFYSDPQSTFSTRIIASSPVESSNPASRTMSPTTVGNFIFFNRTFSRNKDHSKTIGASVSSPGVLPHTLERRIAAANSQPLTSKEILWDKRREYQNVGEALLDCITCYASALNYYETISSELGCTKTRLKLARVQFNYLFPCIAYDDVDPCIATILPQTTRDEYYIPLFDLTYMDNELVAPALRSSVSYHDLMITIDAYLTMAELRYFQGRMVSSKAHWLECSRAIHASMIVDGELLVANQAAPFFLNEMVRIMNGMNRLLFLYEPDFINSNLAVVNLLISCQIAAERSILRTVDNTILLDDHNDSLSSTGSESRDSAFDLTEDMVQNRVYAHQQTSGRSNKTFQFLKASSRRRKTIPLNKQRARWNPTVAEQVWNHLLRMKMDSLGVIKEQIIRQNKQSLQQITSLVNRTSNAAPQTQRQEQPSPRSPPTPAPPTYEPSEISPNRQLSNNEDSNQISTQLVYILQLNDIVICYIPDTGYLQHKRFGGRRRTYYRPPPPPLPTQPKPVKNSPTELKDNPFSSSFINSSNGRPISVSIYTPRERQMRLYGTKTTELDNQMYDYVNTEHYNYARGLFQEKKSKLKIERTSDTVDFLKNGLFKAKWDYIPHDELNQIDVGVTNVIMNLFQKGKNTKKDPPALDSLRMSGKPLLIVSTRYLQVLPFDHMFDHISFKSVKSCSKNKYAPSYFCFYSEDEERLIAPMERTRRDYAFNKYIKGVNKTQSDIHPNYMRANTLDIPVHCPLVKYSRKPKKKKYEFVNYIRMSKLIEDGAAGVMSDVINNTNESQYPVFLFTLTDLMDPCSMVWNVLNSDICVLFIAETCFVEAIKVLTEMQSIFTRSGQLSGNCSPRLGYQFFAQSLQTLRQMHIPVVSFNVPVNQ